MREAKAEPWTVDPSRAFEGCWIVPKTRSERLIHWAARPRRGATSAMTSFGRFVCALLCLAVTGCREPSAAPAPRAETTPTPAPAVPVATGMAESTRTGNAGGVHALTGARTRIVWVQGDGTDPYAAGNALVLMGLDSDDGKGERVILGEKGSYLKPLLISSGKRIVYSSHGKDPADVKVFVVK